MAEWSQCDALYEELTRIELPAPPSSASFLFDIQSVGLYDFDEDEVLPIIDTGETPCVVEETTTEVTGEMTDSQPLPSEEESSSGLVNGMERLAFQSDEGAMSEGSRRHSNKGRRKNPESKLFEQFRSCNRTRGKAKPPKKEYLRLRLIRGFKRSIREVIANKVISRKALHRPDTVNREKWMQFVEMVKANPELLALAETKEGPATDGRAYKTSTDTYRSHNNAYCKDFFTSDVIRCAFLSYLEVVFYEVEEKDLSQKLGFCAIAKTRSERIKAWSELKTYLSQGLLEELNS